MASSTLQRLVRFVPRSSPSKILIGQPADKNIDVGAALRKGQEVAVNVWSGSSVLAPGSLTGTTETIDRVLSPLAQNEVGTVRCVGLNVRTMHFSVCSHFLTLNLSTESMLLSADLSLHQSRLSS
jgi:hypothetical protein